MVEPLQQLQDKLKDNGYSLTAPRRLVFEALQGEKPRTMRELVTSCGDNIDRASIYRTTMLFEKLGITHRIQIGWKYKLELSDIFQHHHHHLACNGCGKLCVLPEDPMLERHIHALAAAHGFIPQDHQLELRGLCLACQSTNPAT
jgi:Fur family ferric uptake transcriptional regulator